MVRFKKETSFTKVLAKALVMVMIVSSILTVGPSNVATAAAKPAISNKISSLLVGKQYDLNIKNKITGAKNTWSSSDKKIATVDKKGVVKALKKGTVTITCTVTKGKTSYKLVNKIAVRQAATSIAISNKVSALNVGQTYDLNRKLAPKTSNDLVTWTSSNKKIANPNAAGVFTALAEGKVTITAKTLSGKTDKVVINVVDAAGTVTSQKELEQLLGSGVSTITIKTDNAIDFTIPEGDYSKTELIVEAPNSDVTNKGVFKNIEILKIKSNSWYEEAKGNKIVVSAPTARVIVTKNAEVSLTVGSKVTNFTLQNDGAVDQLVLDTAANVTITGESKKIIPLVAKVKDLKVTTSLPLGVETTQKITLVLLAGAEKTTVKVDSEANIPVLTGTVKISVSIGTGSNVVTKEVETKPATITGGGSTGGSSTGGGGGGGGADGGGSSTTTKNVSNDGSGKFKLPVELSKVKKVVVNFGPAAYTVSSTTLDELRNFLANDAASIETWKNTTSTPKTYDGQEVTVTGTKGTSQKTVTFNEGPLMGKSYTVDVVNEDTGAIVIIKNYTINQVDNKTLHISNAPVGLSFDITY